ncbi:MAG: hypothetical protein LBC02_14235 [Planctomycetaceae bacterium]|nr:hypothetical protein [Planctomycetaceae bacterium]
MKTFIFSLWQAGTKRSAVTAWNYQKIPDFQFRDECERLVFRQVKAVTVLRSRLPCY